MEIVICATLLAIIFLPAIAVRLVASLAFRRAWKESFFRWGIDTFCFLLVLLTVESMFILREEDRVNNALTARFTTDSEFAGAWYITGLLKVKHFLDYFPIVVLVPSFVVGLGGYSVERSRKKDDDKADDD